MKTLQTALSLIMLIVVVSCTTNQNNGLSKAQEENIKIAKQVYEHFNKHDWEAMAGLYMEPAEFKDPSFGQEVVIQTHKQIVEKYKGLASVFPDIRDDIVSIYSSGDKNVVVEFVSSGTNSDGTKWKLPICTIFTIENGKISKDYNYYDENPAKK